MRLILLTLLTIITTIPLNGMRMTHPLNRFRNQILHRGIFGIDRLVQALNSLENRLKNNTSQLENTLDSIDRRLNCGLDHEGIKKTVLEIININNKKNDRNEENLSRKIEWSSISYQYKDDLKGQAKKADKSVEQYINFVCSLPWDKTTHDKLDMVCARQMLDNDHYGLEEVKERILEFMAIKKLNKDSRSLNALCLIGEPGIGKTSIAVSIAKIFNRKYQIVALSGASNAMYIKGNERGWYGAIPGRIIKAIHLAESSNPVIVLDEIDKVSQSSHNGSPSAALLEVLDPQQNRFFTDNYVEIPFDLSQVLFIATANYKDQIPKELLNRMHVIELPSYTMEDKIQIAQKYLIEKVESEVGLTEHPKHHLLLTSEILKILINEYTNEAGVRELKQVLGRLAAHKARFIVGDPLIKEPPMFTEKNLDMYLSKAKYNSESWKRSLVNNNKE
jgi:endopeptidase La